MAGGVLMKKSPFLLCLLAVLSLLIFYCRSGNEKATNSANLSAERISIERPDYIPKAAWARGMGIPYPEAGKPYTWHIMDDPAWAGAPLGGIGAGSIGRSYRGDFSRWHLDIGSHMYKPVPACQFSVFIDDGSKRQAHVLAPYKPADLSAWNWDMPEGKGTYFALYPKSWFVYDWEELPVELCQKQFSPVIPGNYKETSYPVGIFEWNIKNPTNKNITVSIMFSWQNLFGFVNKNGGNFNTLLQNDDYTGIILSKKADAKIGEDDGSFAIMTRKETGFSISYRSRFDALKDTELWGDFSDNGTLQNVNNNKVSAPYEEIGAALVVTVTLKPNETRKIPFTLAWDFPIMEFKKGTQWYKRYTRFYGTSGKAADKIAIDALKEYPAWEKAIDDWQSPILSDSRQPEWFKCALFNELYFMADGGSAWENGLVKNGVSKQGMGHFAYLETFDYPFYNTFDVHFYASFTLIMLWPELQKGIIMDFADSVQLKDGEEIIIQSNNKKALRKIRGAIPHDLGSPDEDPWLRVNAYNWRDINIWKDLNSKFVLQVYRDYVFSKDPALVKYCWPSVVIALEYLHKFDTNGNHLPDHGGLPDQTYDNWTMTGDSAYTGSLWLAALEAAVKMGRLVGDNEKTTLYGKWLKESRQAFKDVLWNGSYYKFDSSNSIYHDSIMADQLAGQWYAEACGLDPIADVTDIESALRTIYTYNVMGFQDGSMGAVNGMRPDKTVDASCDQSQEVWTGTTYALAALMLHMGMEEQAWKTAWGVYNVVYNRGYWFRTPEAYLKNGDYRAAIYMRPLSIWAIEHAYKNKKMK
jgi:non-lysosomal glucosylceramidase